MLIIRKRTLRFVTGLMAVVSVLIIMAACGIFGGQVVMTVRGTHGQVESSTGDTNNWSPVQIGNALGQGASVRTGADGWAVLELPDQTVVEVEPNTLIALDKLEGTATAPMVHIALKNGVVFLFHDGPVAAGALFEVQADPHGIGSIKGSTMGMLNLAADHTVALGCMTGRCQFNHFMDGTVRDLGVSDNPAAIQCNGLPLMLCNEDHEEVHELELQGSAMSMLFSNALQHMEGLGLLEMAALTGCNCVGDDYVCEDRTYEDFDFCTNTDSGSAEQCQCLGSTLACSGGRFYPGAPACQDFSQKLCACNGSTLTCTDSNVFELDPVCAGGAYCSCAGTTLTCPDGGTTPHADLLCTSESGVACGCVGPDRVCLDGTLNRDAPQCAGNGVPAPAPSSTEASTEDPTSSSPAQCEAGWLPASGCICCGTTYVCADGTVAEFNPTCGVGGTSGGDSCDKSCGDGKCDASCNEDKVSCPADC